MQQMVIYWQSIVPQHVGLVFICLSKMHGQTNIKTECALFSAALPASAQYPEPNASSAFLRT